MGAPFKAMAGPTSGATAPTWQEAGALVNGDRGRDLVVDREKPGGANARASAARAAKITRALNARRSAASDLDFEIDFARREVERRTDALEYWKRQLAALEARKAGR